MKSQKDPRFTKPKVSSHQQGRVRPCTWMQFQTELEALYSPPLRAKATLAKHLQTLREIQNVAENPADVDVVAISRFVRALLLRVAPTTVNSLLRALRTQVHYLLAQGYLDRNPFAVRSFFVREPIREKKHLEVAEVQRLLDQADREVDELDGRNLWNAKRLRSLIYLILYTGLRAGEALHLRIEDCHIADRVVWIKDSEDWQTKTAASRQPVPLPEVAAEVLGSWIKVIDGSTFVFKCLSKDRPWLYGSVARRPCGQVKLLGQRAGVNGVTLLRLRHTWSTHAESLWGLSGPQIARILRHTNIQTQNHYRHADLPNLKELVADHDFRVVRRA